MKAPVISVIMPCYNSGYFLEQAVQSILRQTFTDFELILINDGSTDNTAEIINSFRDTRIVLVNHETNKGLISTLNEGISVSKGKYIARMDADDISTADRFQRQLSFLEANPEYAGVFSKIKQIDLYGNDAGRWKEDEEITSYEEIKNRLPETNCLAHPSVMLRKEIIIKYRYSPLLKHSEDWGLWLDLISDGYKIAKLEEKLLLYRVHTSGTTSTVNRGGVERKIISFQRSYLSKKISERSVAFYHLKIAWQLIKNILLFPWRILVYKFLKKLKRLIQIRPFYIFSSYIRLRNLLKRNRNKEGIFFFFPFYHQGGAEKVHSEIVKVVADKQPWVFFTKFSEGEGKLKDFKENAFCVDIPELCSYSGIKNLTLKLLARYLNQYSNATIFSCNSLFFYELIPLLNKNIKCIDLIHAFIHPLESGPEKWSLPVVSRLSYRVLISKKTMEQMKALYKKEKIDPKLLQRLIFIQNYVNVASEIDILDKRPFKVIYIGRGTPEKRVRLAGKIADRVKNIKFEIQFILVGNVKDWVDEADRKQCEFTGEINDENKLMNLLSECSVLLLTSSREGMPMVIMEAMANGVIPISTAVGGVPFYIENDINGYLVNENEESLMVNEFSMKILELEKDRARLNRMRKQAWNYALDNFKEDKFIKAYRELLNTD